MKKKINYTKIKRKNVGREKFLKDYVLSRVGKTENIIGCVLDAIDAWERIREYCDKRKRSR